MERSLLLLVLALSIINIAAFAAFGIDKARARAKAWRISEGNLLGLALLGGTAGAYLGRWYFRHKTRKTSFSVALHAIAVGQATFLIWALTPVARLGG
jgi:uncharacterized membrane protein YsdA (DUF1294 family)